MKFVSLIAFVSVLCVWLTGCVSLDSTRSAGDFVCSVNVLEFDTFTYKETVLSGSAFRENQELEIQELSPLVLSDALSARGFEAVESDGDFYVVVEWRKGLSAYSGPFDSVDGPAAAMNRRNNSKSSSVVRVAVSVELYETATDQLFWRAELPNIFDATQYTEDRVSRSLLRAIQNFPSR